VWPLAAAAGIRVGSVSPVFPKNQGLTVVSSACVSVALLLLNLVSSIPTMTQGCDCILSLE
jgi:hypothetical protein